MSDEPEALPPGRYYAQGDPPGTQRYWDGSAWQGEPEPVAESAQADDGPRLAEPVNRIGARIIDYIVWIVVLVLSGFLFSNATGLNVSGQSDEVGYGANLAATILFVALVSAYEVVMVAKRGATLGKLAMGLRVVRADGSPVDLRTAVLRVAPFTGLQILVALVGRSIGGFVFVVLLTVAFASLVLLFTDGKRQTVWDKVARTIVVPAP